ncbi:hypothetical protein GMMP15_670011 [Candidatus Magnetomoraceae bacterium gMMP-15]
MAQTQGQIGYMIESTLDTELMKLGINDKYFRCKNSAFFWIKCW